MVIIIIIWEDYSIEMKGSVVMKMAYRISTAVIVLLTLALIAPAAAAQFGYGPAACGGPVTYGAPQNCVATVSCNIPVTTQVPVMTTTTVPQTVPICVPVQDVTTVTVPKVVVVPETVPVPYVRPTMSTTTVPVCVPVQSSVPVTTMVPQCYTVPLGGAGLAGLTGAPGGLAKGMAPNMGLGKGMGAAGPSGAI